jgi:hypothetical protein
MQHVTVLLLALLFVTPCAAAPAPPMADDPRRPCGGFYACIERGAGVKASERRLAILNSQVPLRPEPTDLPSAGSAAPKR